ncbi:methyltransferase domain-containing protein [uncultured Paraglaciecola sp.]|jgi:predicted methyltransferase|uniref:class I SAM-dependent methyltransferase n=1 Tax=uncultured Paraglaciecola sp. TaxID=1765024 RepID=UPI0025D87908|nr:methyltransferase domain-containing protein [uncultured Paraglaciecola sp.]
MKRFLFLSFIALASQTTVYAEQALNQQQIQAVLDHQDRPAEDSKRDSARQPAKVLAFTNVAEGDQVLDLFAGGGWYTELFSKAVGQSGKVYAQNDQVIWRFAEKGITQRTKNNRLNNVIRFDNMPIVDMNIPDESLDIVFVALNYHDLFFTDTTQDGKKVQLRDDIVDYKAALATIKKALKKEGVFIIIDHLATSGSGYQAANTLHRIDPNIVKFQLNEAGFSLIEEAHYLRNPEDDLTKNVFAPETRGKTDRFIYKFSKK